MKVAKKVLLTVPGIGRLESLPGAEFDPGGVSYSAVVTESGNVHDAEEDRPAKVVFKVANLPGHLEKLRGLRGINLNVQDETGQSWIITSAFVTGDSPKASGGEISMEMQGNSAEQV